MLLARYTLHTLNHVTKVQRQAMHVFALLLLSRALLQVSRMILVVRPHRRTAFTCL